MTLNPPSPQEDAHSFCNPVKVEKALSPMVFPPFSGPILFAINEE